MSSLAQAPKPVKLAALKAQLGRLAYGRGEAGAGRDRSLTPVPDPGGALSEILPVSYADTPSAFAFLVALAARAAALRSGPVLLSMCERQFDFGIPHPCALAAAGLSPSRVLLVRAPDPKGALWALEEGARTPGVAVSMAAGLADQPYGLLASRRLALAIERTGVPVLLLRAAGARTPSAARYRWRVQGAPGVAAPFLGAAGLPGLSARRWRLTQERALGAPSSFEVEWNETALCFDPPAALVRGPGAAERTGSPAIRAA
jgi:protein ImuA